MRRRRCPSSCGAKLRCTRLGGLCWPGCMQVSATMWSPRWAWLLVVQVLHDIGRQQLSGRISYASSPSVVWRALVHRRRSICCTGVHCVSTPEHLMVQPGRCCTWKAAQGLLKTIAPACISLFCRKDGFAPPRALGSGPLCLQASSLCLWLRAQTTCLASQSSRCQPPFCPGRRHVPSPHCILQLTQPHHVAGVLLSKRCAHRIHPLLARGGAAGSPGAHKGTNGGTDSGLPGWQVGLRRLVSRSAGAVSHLGTLPWGVAWRHVQPVWWQSACTPSLLSLTAQNERGD